MTITLTISDEQVTELQRMAAAAGTDLQSFILNAVEDRLESRNGALYDAPFDQWSKEYRTWVASQTSHNANFDDSRASVYD
jgi:hypothetical protein